MPVNFGNLRNPKRDMLWVAAAGPGANSLMALLWALRAHGARAARSLASEGLQMMARVGIMINVVLMALNLLPILPLDGGRIAVSLLPHRAGDALLAARALRIHRDHPAAGRRGCSTT